MDNMENMDFEAMRDKQADELMQLLDERRMKELQLRLEDMNEFDVAEFLSEIGDNRMPMVFRLLSKQMAADVFANFDSPEQEQIINSITDSELSAIIEELYVDDADEAAFLIDNGQRHEVVVGYLFRRFLLVIVRHAEHDIRVHYILDDSLIV